MLSVIILAGGNSTRLGTGTSKALIEFAGSSLFYRVCETASQLMADQYVVVVPEEHSAIKAECPIPNVTWAIQNKARGTGAAVNSALKYLSNIEHKVLILCADIPLVNLSDLQNLISSNYLELLTAIPDDPGSMGRIKRDINGEVVGIIEASDACANDLEITEVFSGIMQTPSKLLRSFLPSLKDDNRQGEYYLTDIVKYARNNNHRISSSLALPWWSVQGVNTLCELTRLERKYMEIQAENLQKQGVRILDPNRFECRGKLDCGKNITIDINVIIQGNVSIGSNCYIGPGVILENCKIADNVKVFANSIIKDSFIAHNTTIGPFAYVRPQTEIANDCRIGSFVEIKSSRVGPRSKIPHLSYIGDCKIGSNVNIGAGVITCNYNGYKKQTTAIADNCFIGAGVQLIAPIEVGANAKIGAGTCIRENIEKGYLAVNQQSVVIKKRKVEADTT